MRRLEVVVIVAPASMRPFTTPHVPHSPFQKCAPFRMDGHPARDATFLLAFAKNGGISFGAGGALPL